MRLRAGPPPLEAVPANFDYLYSDIREDFFERARRADGKEVYRTRRPGGAPQEFPVEKPANARRVFVIGGSVAQPFSYMGLPLEMILGRALPGLSIEVVYCGMAGYDIYREGLIEREILAYRPDAIVLLSGHNEHHNPVRLDPTLYRMNRLLRRSWAFRRLQDAYASAPRVPTREERRRGFETSLRLMVRRGKARGVPIVLCTLPLNLRDFPPARSLEELPGAEAALAAFDRGDYTAAKAAFRLLSKTDPSAPLPHYWLARSLDRAGSFEEAWAEYRTTAEVDGFLGRITPSGNESVRRVAHEEGAAVADLEKSFAELAPHRLVGDDFFIDSVHWYNEYYPLAALVISSAAADAGILAPSRDWDWRWLSKERMEITRPRPRPEFMRFTNGDYELRRILTGIQIAVDRCGSFNEQTLAFFQSALRREPGRLDLVLASPQAVRAAIQDARFGRNDNLTRCWPDVLAHAGESYRRSGYGRKARRWFNTALQLQPGNALALRGEARLNGHAR
jgi:tetratricopeptide (TPR) repeat protein